MVVSTDNMDIVKDGSALSGEHIYFIVSDWEYKWSDGEVETVGIDKKFWGRTGLSF